MTIKISWQVESAKGSVSKDCCSYARQSVVRRLQPRILRRLATAATCEQSFRNKA